MGLDLLVVVVAVPAGLYLISFVVEALRRRPEEPQALSWAPDVDIQHIDVKSSRLRFVQVGEGPQLLLLHTLRTQLDIYHMMLPELQKRFTVTALDYPGHGWSDIPGTDYTPDMFAEHVEAFMDALDLVDVTLAGVSIGGTLPLMIAARQNTRVARVVSINPYDYAGDGFGRGNVVAKVTVLASSLPVVGETFMRLRNDFVESIIFRGGVAHPEAISKPLMSELLAVGKRPGHYRAFLNLVRHAELWNAAHRDYSKINLPTLLIYGDKDWSNEEERERTRRGIPGVRMETIAGGGHFLSLDRPQELIRHIKDFASPSSR